MLDDEQENTNMTAAALEFQELKEAALDVKNQLMKCMQNKCRLDQDIDASMKKQSARNEKIAKLLEAMKFIEAECAKVEQKAHMPNTTSQQHEAILKRVQMVDNVKRELYSLNVDVAREDRCLQALKAVGDELNKQIKEMYEVVQQLDALLAEAEKNGISEDNNKSIAKIISQVSESLSED